MDIFIFFYNMVVVSMLYPYLQILSLTFLVPALVPVSGPRPGPGAASRLQLLLTNNLNDLCREETILLGYSSTSPNTMILLVQKSWYKHSNYEHNYTKLQDNARNSYSHMLLCTTMTLLFERVA